MISIHLTSKAFGDTLILRDIDLILQAGETAAIVGPSGIGKSTLLRIIAGIDTEYQGQVARSPHLGMVFQEPTLLPWRTVRRNLSVFHAAATPQDIDRMLDRIGLFDHAEKFPGQLSLGQQRRLSIARAFLDKPESLILDEPFASLDPALRKDMLRMTADLLADVRPATLLVTHDLAEAEHLTSQIFTLKGRPATLSEGAV